MECHGKLSKQVIWRFCLWVTGRKEREGWSHDKAEIPEAETRGSQPGDAGLATRVYEYLSLNIKFSVHFLQKGFRVFIRFSMDIAPNGSRTAI